MTSAAERNTIGMAASGGLVLCLPQGFSLQLDQSRQIECIVGLGLAVLFELFFPCPSNSSFALSGPSITMPSLSMLELFSPLQSLIIICFLISAIVFLGIAVFARTRKLAQFARLHGCESPTVTYPGSGFLFGLNYILAFIPHIRARRFAAYTHELFTKFGPTFVTTVAGKVVVHTSDPENLKAVFSTCNQDYDCIPARAALASTIYGPGIFATNGLEWLHSRSLVRQALKTISYDDDVFERHVDAMVEDLKTSNSGTLDFSHNALQYTWDVVFELYFGESSKSKDATQANRSLELARGFAYLGKVGRELTIFGRRIPYVIDFLHVGWRRQRAAIESILEYYLEQAQTQREKSASSDENEKQRKTLVQTFAEATGDKKRAKTEIMNLLLAGGDSVAIALSEAIWLLARHPAVFAKLRAEVQAAFPNQKPLPSHLGKCEYLKSVVNESLRLRPILAVHGRYASCDTVLPRGGGPDSLSPLLVPKNSYVVYSHYSINRSEAVFGSDVEAFRPERWLDGKEPSTVLPGETAGSRLKVDRYQFLAFGAGARACVGEKLASLIVPYAIARIAQEFEVIQPRDDRPWEEVTAWNFFNRHGVHVAFKKA